MKNTACNIVTCGVGEPLKDQTEFSVGTVPHQNMSSELPIQTTPFEFTKHIGKRLLGQH
jgi:hypothetical protein